MQGLGKTPIQAASERLLGKLVTEEGEADYDVETSTAEHGCAKKSVVCLRRQTLAISPHQPAGFGKLRIAAE